MDFIASKMGLKFQFNSIQFDFSKFLGGKASFVQSLDKLGFQTTFALESYVIRGSELRYLLTYGNDWRIYITDDDGEPLFLGESASRPDYNRIDALLEKNLVGQKVLRDLGTGAKLTSESIKVLYSDIDE